MAKEVLVVPEEHLSDVISVIRAGLKEHRTSYKVSENLRQWCDSEARYLSGDPTFEEELAVATDKDNLDYHDSTHTLRIALIRLCRGSLDHPPPEMYKMMAYTKGDEDAPLMSETMLYVLFGKEPARTILVRMREVLLLAGFTEDETRRLT